MQGHWRTRRGPKLRSSPARSKNGSFLDLSHNAHAEMGPTYILRFTMMGSFCLSAGSTLRFDLCLRLRSPRMFRAGNCLGGGQSIASQFCASRLFASGVRETNPDYSYVS